MTTDMGQVIRWMTAEEVAKWVLPVFREHGVKSAEGKGFIGLFEDDELVGFLGVSKEVHLEPCWIAPESRGTLVAKQMFRFFEEHFPGVPYFSTTEDDRVASGLKRLGMKELPWRTFRKEMQGELFPEQAD